MSLGTPTVIYEKRNQIAYITLNRPKVLNALNLEMQDGIRVALTDFRDDSQMLVAVISGAGDRAFSAGADLREVASRTSDSEQRSRRFPLLGDLNIWKPIIGAIDGYCLAGGLELALQCDIRIATAHSELGLPEPRWSLTAGYGLHHLSRMIPLGESLYLQLTGTRITADEAFRIGLVHKVLSDRQQLMLEVDQIAEEIKLCAPLAVQAIKQIILQGRNLPVEEAHRLAQPIQSFLASTIDRKEGPQAFVEKRRPVWRSQ